MIQARSSPLQRQIAFQDGSDRPGSEEGVKSQALKPLGSIRFHGGQGFQPLAALRSARDWRPGASAPGEHRRARFLLISEHVHHRPHRLSPECYKGTRAYFVTICTHDRQRHFLDPATVEHVRLHILRAAEAERFEVLAYCFMPDHVHAVLIGHSSSTDLLRLLNRSKQTTAFDFARTHASRLWQGGWFDRVVRSGEDALLVADYVVCNPVRAGLVSSPTEYPYWGSQRHSREELLDAIACAKSGPRG